MYKLTTIQQTITELLEISNRLETIKDEKSVDSANIYIVDAISELVKVKDAIEQQLEERK